MEVFLFVRWPWLIVSDIFRLTHKLVALSIVTVNLAGTVVLGVRIIIIALNIALFHAIDAMTFDFVVNIVVGVHLIGSEVTGSHIHTIELVCTICATVTPVLLLKFIDGVAD